MSSRFNLFRFRYNGIERMANRRLGKVPDEKKFKVADIFVFFGGMFIADCFFGDAIVSVEIDAAIGFVLLLIGGFLNFRRLSPRACWQRGMRTGFIAAALWGLTTWICYYADALALNQALWLSIEPVIFLIIAIVALIRWRYIRRRSLQTIIRLRLERKRQRNYCY